MAKFNYKIIFHFFGLLLLFNGGFMLLSALVSLLNEDGVTLELFVSGIAVLIAGVILMLLTKKHSKVMNKREGYIVVTFGWIVMAISGAIPYMVTNAIPTFTSAFFETMSGYTTTGATILNDIEIVPKGVLFWRSTTHWIGGMGIIVLAIAILPLLGIGGMQLFSAEAPGPSSDKLHPRITDTAKRLWLIYFGYTVAETILLKVAGMSFFDAINHSMSTLSTGGFSTKNASVAYWNDKPMIQYIIIAFMFLAGTNFVLSYYAFKGKVQRALGDEELRWYFRFIASFTIIVALIVYFRADFSISTI
jgi:trk system potassium uptake protein TrkH